MIQSTTMFIIGLLLTLVASSVSDDSTLMHVSENADSADKDVSAHLAVSLTGPLRCSGRMLQIELPNDCFIPGPATENDEPGRLETDHMMAGGKNLCWARLQEHESLDVEPTVTGRQVSARSVVPLDQMPVLVQTSRRVLCSCLSVRSFQSIMLEAWEADEVGKLFNIHANDCPLSEGNDGNRIVDGPHVDLTIMPKDSGRAFKAPEDENTCSGTLLQIEFSGDCISAPPPETDDETDEDMMFGGEQFMCEARLQGHGSTIESTVFRRRVSGRSIVPLGHESVFVPTSSGVQMCSCLSDDDFLAIRGDVDHQGQYVAGNVFNIHVEPCDLWLPEGNRILDETHIDLTIIDPA